MRRRVRSRVLISLRHYYPERWDGVGTDFSIEQHAQDVAALIKKLNLGKVHLVGHSRGGAVVIEVAKLNPEVIRTLVLPDASIQMPVPESAEAKEAAEFTKKTSAPCRKI
jgi:pimeloyl-ACP methyl ester carboxylesterase